MKKYIYIMIMSSFLAAQVFAINLSVFQLSIYRIFIILILAIIIFRSFKPSGYKIVLYNNNNKYSIQFMLIWLLYAFISLMWIKDLGGWIKNIYFLTSGILGIIYINIYIKKQDDLISLFFCMQIMIVLHNAIGWYEVITRDYRFITVYDKLFYISRGIDAPISMLGNPNDFATLMVVGFFISYICILNSKKTFFKFLNCLVMFSCFALVLKTNSRANLLGIILGIFVLFCLKIRSKRRYKYFIAFGIGFIIILLLILYGKDISNIFNIIFHFDFSGTTLNSEFVRVNLILNGLYFLLRTFGFGTGAGNIEYWMYNYKIFPTNEITNIHNWWVEILVAYGIVIFSLYILFYFKLLKNMFKKIKLFNDNIAISLLACLSAFIISSISSSSNLNKEWLWMFFGVVIAYQGLDEKSA